MPHSNEQEKQLDDVSLDDYQEKFNSIDIDQALLESINLAPEEYAKVYALCKALKDISNVKIDQVWQLQAFRGIFAIDDLEKRDHERRSVAHYAAFSGHLDVLDLIKNHKPQLLKRLDCSDHGIYSYGIYAGNLSILNLDKSI